MNETLCSPKNTSDDMKKNYIIHREDSYYRGIFNGEPLFGGTKNGCIRFKTKSDAEDEMSKHYAFASCEIEEIGETFLSLSGHLMEKVDGESTCCGTSMSRSTTAIYCPPVCNKCGYDCEVKKNRN